MRLRNRNKVIDRQSLSNIRFAKFTAELNQAVEAAYKSLEVVLGAADRAIELNGLQDNTRNGTVNRPPNHR